MKKIIFTLLLVITLSSSALFADMDYVTTGMTGGYSLVSDSPSFGFNTSYEYMARIGNNTYFGINTHADLNILIKDNKVNVGTGLLLGPAFGLAINNSNFLSITAAPALYFEVGSDYEYTGFGLGFDVNHTFYMGSDNDFGLTLGATAYTTFLNLMTENNEYVKSPVGFDCTGYIAFSFRSGDYTGDKDIYYNIY